MKRTKNTMYALCLCLVLMLTATIDTAVAQGVNTSIGLKAGVNAAQLSQENRPNNAGSRIGANVGAVLNYSVIDHFGITGELVYSMRGESYDNSNNDIKLDYVEIAILPSYYFFLSDNFVPKVFVGGSYNHLLSAKLGDADASTTYNEADINLILGAGAHLRLGNGRWFVFDLRYNFGLSDITVAPNTVRNGVFSINLGVTFPLGTY
ncbi:MAG: PorT family protein [Bernardetiaceae bacterium]|nr:PorT family protein [Bernardetiaceae bacterium]